MSLNGIRNKKNTIFFFYTRECQSDDFYSFRVQAGVHDKNLIMVNVQPTVIF